MKKLEGAGALIINEDNKLLLIHRNYKDQIRWELPGGKVEKDEELEDTVKREFKEELDIDISVIKYLGYDIFDEGDFSIKYHWFLGTIIDGEAKLMENKFDDMGYFSKDELLKRDDLSINMKRLLDKNIF